MTNPERSLHAIVQEHVNNYTCSNCQVISFPPGTRKKKRPRNKEIDKKGHTLFAQLSKSTIKFFDWYWHRLHYAFHTSNKYFRANSIKCAPAFLINECINLQIHSFFYCSKSCARLWWDEDPLLPRNIFPPMTQHTIVIIVLEVLWPANRWCLRQKFYGITYLGSLSSRTFCRHWKQVVDE